MEQTRLHVHKNVSGHAKSAQPAQSYARENASTSPRKRLCHAVKDVEQHLQTNGPWQYKMSWLYDEPEVTAEVERLVAQQQQRIAA